MDTEDAIITHALSQFAAPLASKRTASAAASDTEMKVVVRVRDRSDCVSDLDRPRYGESQWRSEPIGPLTILFFSSIGSGSGTCKARPTRRWVIDRGTTFADVCDTTRLEGSF